MKTKKERQSNIELLRCLLMLMVVVLHYNNAEMGGGFAYASGINYRVLQFLEAVSVCAVNCFILISAYFLSGTRQRSLKKPLGLIGMTIAYKVLCYIVSVRLGQSLFSARELVLCLIPNNWFVILFCVLYMISPYINPLFEALEKKELQKCIAVCLLLFSVYPTVVESASRIIWGTSGIAGIGTVTMNGSESGYTIVNFVLLYLLGGYLRKYPPQSGKAKYFGLYAAFTLCDFAMAWVTPTYTSYANIFVIGQAVMLFLAFLNWDLKSSRVINTVSRSAFGIYLLHTCSLFIVTFWGYFQIPASVSGTTGRMILRMGLAVLAMYLVCLLVDMVCRGIWGFLVRLIEKIIRKCQNKNI